MKAHQISTVGQAVCHLCTVILFDPQHSPAREGCSQFTDKETEAQRRNRICPRSQRTGTSGLTAKPASSESQSLNFHSCSHSLSSSIQPFNKYYRRASHGAGTVLGAWDAAGFLVVGKKETRRQTNSKHRQGNKTRAILRGGGRDAASADQSGRPP